MAERVFTQTFGVVGAILEKDGKILLIREADPGPDQNKWSHPAGWIDVGENPIDAVKREVKEESGFDFEPTALLGIYSLVRKDRTTGKGTPHAIKLLFVGNISESQSELASDSAETKWFLPEEIYAMDAATLRDVDIKQAVKDCLAGKRYSLEMLKHTISE
ncbi:MAG TPA: NUDIX domain-containing protein [Patescibacteria group bacterium]|jgi:ADP-ribose pyrophosphatase YjhB (NUDIX family)|nr:NUDIX domain-containing protein [Patescibacteria group bacterium]